MKKKQGMQTVILLTVLGCIICVGSALLIAWIGNRHAPQESVLADDTEKSHTERRSQVIFPQWLFYQSVGGDGNKEMKTYLDVLVNRWTKGELTDDELSGQMTDYLVKKEIPISTMGVQSEALCLFPSAQELPDYTAMLTNESRNGIYDFIGVYTNGEYDEDGRLICYYWEAGVIGV